MFFLIASSNKFSEQGVWDGFEIRHIGFHMEPSHLICSANQLTGFYMKYTGMKMCITCQIVKKNTRL